MNSEKNTQAVVDVVATVRIQLNGIPARHTVDGATYGEIVRAIIEDAIGHCDDGLEILDVQEFLDTP